MWPTNLSAPSRPRASRGKRTPKAPSGGSARRQPGPLAGRGRVEPAGRSPFLAYSRTLDQAGGSSLPLFSAHSTQPREGLCAPKYRPSTRWPSGQVSALGKWTLCLRSPSQVQWARGRIRLQSRWGRRSVAFSCRKKATADWNHVVGIKSSSPSFLSLIGGALFIRLKETVKYLSINEPHLPVDLLT